MAGEAVSRLHKQRSLAHPGELIARGEPRMAGRFIKGRIDLVGRKHKLLAKRGSLFSRGQDRSPVEKLLDPPAHILR